jgi:hypothetical protein
VTALRPRTGHVAVARCFYAAPVRRTAITLAIVALTATACGSGLPDIDTTPALEALDAANDAAALGPGGALETCPIRDVDVLIDQAFRLVDDESTRDALDSDETDTVLRTIGSSPVILCGRSADSELAIGISIGRGDASIDAHVERLTEPEIDPEVDLTVRADYRGGQVARFCLLYSGEPSLDVCEVVWTDTNVSVATFAGSSAASDVDLSAVEERFIPIVQLVLDSISDD